MSGLLHESASPPLKEPVETRPGAKTVQAPVAKAANLFLARRIGRAEQVLAGCPGLDFETWDTGQSR